MKKNAAAFVGAIAVAGLLLTGCAGGAQSKADACKLIETELSDSTAQLSSAVSTLGTDPDGASKTLNDYKAQFSSTVSKIDNADIKPSAQAAEKSLITVIDLLVEASSDPASADQTALTDAVTAFQTDGTALQTACTS